MNDPNYKRVTATQDQYKIDNPDFATKYNADNFAKYGTVPKSLVDKQYDDLKGQYANIGGTNYDQMSKLINDFMAKGDKKSAGVILGSAAYKQAKAARDQFMDDNPEFATRYKAETEAKYGPSKTSTATTTAAKSGSNNGSSKSSGYSSGYTAKKTTTSSKKKRTARRSAKSGLRPGHKFGLIQRPGVRESHRHQEHHHLHGKKL
jgi:hypothetical protein